MQESNQNNKSDIVFKDNGMPSFLREIIRIKHSTNPLIILSIFLSQYSTPTNCFYPSGKITTFDKSINIFLSGIKGSILSETMRYISFLDFQLSIGNDQLKNSDYYLLHKIFFMYPTVLQSSISFIISSQHPLIFFSICVLSPHFDQQVFQYQLKQTFREDPAILNRILKYISLHKYPINQALYNNFSRVISTKSLEEALSNTEIIQILEPIKYNKKLEKTKNLSISNAQIFDRNTNISKDIQSLHLLNSQSYIRTNLNNQLKRTRPDGNSFYVDGTPSSKDVFTRSCKLDKNKSVSIVPQKFPNKDIIIFILIFIILAMLVFIFWNHTLDIHI